MELYLNEEGLIDEERWISLVSGLQESVGEELEKEEAKRLIKKELISAVRKRIKGKFGILFSGGVDSSVIALVCRDLKADFTCYAVGFKTSGMDMPPDIEYAQKVAESLGVALKTKVYDLEETEEIIKETVNILPKPLKIDIDYMVKVGVAGVVVAAQKLSDEKLFFSGLGSEEIFAGYERHSKVDDVNSECWSGLKKMWQRDLIRDFTVAQKLGVDIATPFLDEYLIKTAMSIPSSRKLSGEERKIILRKVAEEMGLEKEYAWRKKMGAQYGSRINKVMDKLAHKKGFKLKRDYLKSLF
ncbi:asparagine synthase-related protein [Thermoproteota archaeon]